MITHWDPDLYPTRPIPPIQELVVQVLTNRVLLKEVDLLLNPTLRSALKDAAIMRQFDSLLHTGRIKILLPPPATTTFDIDPNEQPMTAVALERERSKRPFKTKPWKMTRADQHFCADLDKVITSARAIQFRKDYPHENQFARTLASVLSNPDRLWRRRPEFRGIDDKMADKFVAYCEDPSLALADLRRQNISPNASQFYRSLAYQCADLYAAEPGRTRSMKNLLQSVYTKCELDREGSQGTYYGSRIAELPPTDEELDGQDLLGLQELVLPDAAEIPVAENIGEVVSRVWDECSTDLSDLCAPDERRDVNAIMDKWAHVADAFARYSVNLKSVKWTAETNERWHGISHRIHAALFLLEGAIRVAVRFGHEFSARPQLETGILTGSGMTLCSKRVVHWIRKGRAYNDRDIERARVRDALLNAKGIRTGAI